MRSISWAESTEREPLAGGLGDNAVGLVIH